MSETPFHSLDDFITLRRQSNLTLSPDGRRLVVAVQELNRARTAWVTALWEVDPTGARDAVRLTRSAPGESSPGFTPDGDLVFVSRRPEADGDSESGNEEKPQLWLLPERGEARLYARRPGGVSGFAVARDSGTVLVGSDTMPGATSLEDDRKAREYRTERKIAALLHGGEPIRFWDHDLGPGMTRLFLGVPGDRMTEGASDETDGDQEPVGSEASNATTARADLLGLRDLTPDAGGALFQASYDLAPDGGTVVSTWRVPLAGGDARVELRRMSIGEPGAISTLATDSEHDFHNPVISPDGRFVVARRIRHRACGKPPVGERCG